MKMETRKIAAKQVLKVWRLNCWCLRLANLTLNRLNWFKRWDLKHESCWIIPQTLGIRWQRRWVMSANFTKLDADDSTSCLFGSLWSGLCCCCCCCCCCWCCCCLFVIIFLGLQTMTASHQRKQTSRKMEAPTLKNKNRYRQAMIDRMHWLLS